MNHALENESLIQRLQALFGVDAHSENPLAQSGAGVRFTGIDLCRPLSAAVVRTARCRLGRMVSHC